MDWQLVASYFTVKSTDIYCSVSNAKTSLNFKTINTLEFMSTRRLNESLNNELLGVCCFEQLGPGNNIESLFIAGYSQTCIFSE